MRRPPGGGDELLEPRLLHSQRSLDVEEDDGTQDVKRERLLRTEPENLKHVMTAVMMSLINRI